MPGTPGVTFQIDQEGLSNHPQPQRYLPQLVTDETSMGLERWGRIGLRFSEHRGNQDGSEQKR